MKIPNRHRVANRAVLAVTACGAFAFAQPAQAGNPVGQVVYAPNPNGNGDSRRMDAWVNWNPECGAGAALQCHTYMKIVSTRNNHVAGGWISGTAGWNVTYAPKPTSMPSDWTLAGPVTSRKCEKFRTVVEHYTEGWGQGGTFAVSITAPIKAVDVGLSYSFAPGMKVTTGKQMWVSDWTTICPTPA